MKITRTEISSYYNMNNEYYSKEEARELIAYLRREIDNILREHNELLENKLIKVVGEEEYERAAILKKWIDLLEEYHEKKNIKKNNKRRTS